MLIEIFSSITSYEMPFLKSVYGCATLQPFCAKITNDFSWAFFVISWDLYLPYIIEVTPNQGSMENGPLSVHVTLIMVLRRFYSMLA